MWNACYIIYARTFFIISVFFPVCKFPSLARSGKIVNVSADASKILMTRPVYTRQVYCFKNDCYWLNSSDIYSLVTQEASICYLIGSVGLYIAGGQSDETARCDSVCGHTHTHTHTHIYKYAHTHSHTHTHTHTHTHLDTHIYKYAHTHSHTY